MSLEPLKSLWQQQQTNMSALDLIKHAKFQQRRMLGLMILDFVVWISAIVWACIIIKANDKPESFFLGLFIILFASLGTAYMLWLRTITWGAGELDSKSIIKLSIHRCEAAMQLVNVTYIFSIITFSLLIVLELIFDIPNQKLLKVVVWLIVYGALTVGVGEWYRRRQKAKKLYFEQLLAQHSSEQR